MIRPCRRWLSLRGARCVRPMGSADAADCVGPERPNLPDVKRRKRTNSSKSPAGVQTSCRLAPDGRMCCACGNTDDSEDPVDKACGVLREDGSVPFRKWGLPPTEEGKTQGRLCWYCLRVFNGRYAHMPQEPGVAGSRFHTSATWTKSLGTDPEELGKVRYYSAQVENFFIQSGGRSNAHLPWGNMDKEVLTLQESRLNRWEDADDVWDLKDYIEAHGNPATNGKESHGHPAPAWPSSCVGASQGGEVGASHRIQGHP
jgi:hypothetical protein